MVRPAAAEERDRDPAERASAGGLQLLPPEDVAVKRGGSLDVAHVQDDVPQFLDLHASKLTRSARSQTARLAPRRHRAARLSEDGEVRVLRLSYQQIIAMIYVVAMFMTIMDATIVYVALPAIARSFAVSPAATDGVVVGYLVSLAVWIPASGWVG